MPSFRTLLGLFGDAGFISPIFCLQADDPIRLYLPPRGLLLEIELSLLYALHPGWRPISPCDFPQLDQSILGGLEQGCKLISQALLLEEEVVIEVEFVIVGSRWLREVLYLLAEDFAVDPGIEFYQQFPDLEQFLSQEGIFLDCQGQVTLIPFKEEGVFVHFFFLGWCFQWKEYLKTALVDGQTLLTHALLHLFADSRRFGLFFLHFMQCLLIFGPQTCDYLPILLSLLPCQSLSLLALSSQPIQLILQHAHLPQMFLSCPLSLFRKASKLIPLKLQSREVVLHPTPKLQILLPMADQLHNASQGDLIVSAEGQLPEGYAPSAEDAPREGTLLLEEGLLRGVGVREGGETGVVESVGLVDFGEVVCQEGVVHYLNIISAYGGKPRRERRGKQGKGMCVLCVLLGWQWVDYKYCRYR